MLVDDETVVASEAVQAVQASCAPLFTAGILHASLCSQQASSTQPSVHSRHPPRSPLFTAGILHEAP
eukprot:scaffold28182_cov126-Isochrysis_galbana.AAC.5